MPLLPTTCTCGPAEPSPIAEPLPFACDLTALAPDQRASHLDRVHELLHQRALALVPLANGYRFQFAPDDLSAVADFVSRERRCCPFLGFSLALESEGRALWLELTGREGTRGFLEAELGIAGQ